MDSARAKAKSALDDDLQGCDGWVPKEAICLLLEGNAWCCVSGDYIDPHESPFGCGDTPLDAMRDLRADAIKSYPGHPIIEILDKAIADIEATRSSAAG